MNSSASGALSISGNAIINVSGVVYVDSSSSSAISASGNASVTASAIDVHGGVQKSGNATFKPAPTTGVSSLSDPLASLPAPSTSGLKNYGSESVSGNSSATIKPGIYTSISVSGNGSLTMGAGVYIIEGGGFSTSGNASVNGSGVLIFNAGSNYPNQGGSYGAISLSGNGTTSLSPASTGSYAGVVIIQPSGNTDELSLSGNSMAGMSGTIYAPGAELSQSGNAELNMTLDVNSLSMSGNATAQFVGMSQPANVSRVVDVEALPGSGSKSPATNQPAAPVSNPPAGAGRVVAAQSAAGPVAQGALAVGPAIDPPADLAAAFDSYATARVDRDAGDLLAADTITIVCNVPGVRSSPINAGQGIGDGGLNATATLPVVDAALDDWISEGPVTVVAGLHAVEGAGPRRPRSVDEPAGPAGPLALKEPVIAADTPEGRFAGAVLVAGYCGQGALRRRRGSRRSRRP